MTTKKLIRNTSLSCSLIQMFGYTTSVIMQFMANGIDAKNVAAGRVFMIFFLWVGMVNVCLIICQIIADIMARKITGEVYTLAFVNGILLLSVPLFMLGLM